MSEKIIRALMRLFAIIGKADELSAARPVVESFLKQQLNSEQVNEYLLVYDEYLKQQEEGADSEKKKRRLAVSSVKVIVICEQINEELTQKQKFVVLLNLMEFVCHGGKITDLELEFISTVSSSFNISENEFNQCLEIATHLSIEELGDLADLLLISKQKPEGRAHSKFLQAETLSGTLAVLRVQSISLYLVRYYGKSELLLNGQGIVPGRIYILSQGSTLRSAKLLPIYYSDVVSCFLKDASDNPLTYHINDIEYKFAGGKIGLHPLNFIENSGKLIGIMGGSGAGKSTLLNILNGNNKPSAGNVLINGHDLHREKKHLEGVIGYVPQDDLLIEQLTVYQNLFYNSKLCFADKSDEEIDKLVVSMLNDLGLYETRDLKVGSTLDKTISGGQRKRLNIALELIREPSVLFVDEPTSGLSSRDSENIMDLLKELALKGKLVFVVIHQPSSDIFKMFDKLLILDNGGYPIYYGNPVESVIYFRTITSQVNANESECQSCGNVNPEQVFNIIESKVLDENGNQTRNRKISPKEWNKFYTEKNSVVSNGAAPRTGIKNTFRKPGFLKQLKVFITRDVLSKLSNKQYLGINLLEAPVLALVLASLIKYFKNDGDYLFSDNKNMPAYLFMCVLVALFIGLTVSAEEIIGDRKILKRESFLNLSKGSYILSKIIILFTLSAIQTLSFVLIGNWILGIHGMYMDYWLVLFTTSCFANMLGLNISSAFNSAVTIYILIPFLLIPQILLSGVIVKFEELNPKISAVSVVPFWGDIMTSRWAFEALTVNQYVHNKYELNIYPYEKEMSNAGYKKIYWYSKMGVLADECVAGKDPKDNWSILQKEVKKETSLLPSIPFTKTEQLNAGSGNAALVKELKDYLNAVKKHYSERYDVARMKKDDWLVSFQTNDAARAQFKKLLSDNQNTKIEDLVKNVASDLDPAIVEDGELVTSSDPIYRDGPRDRFLRSHFFAPRKNVFGNLYDTFWVNLGVIWAMSLFLWGLLYVDGLRKLIGVFEKLVPQRKK